MPELAQISSLAEIPPETQMGFDVAGVGWAGFVWCLWLGLG